MNKVRNFWNPKEKRIAATEGFDHHETLLEVQKMPRRGRVQTFAMKKEPVAGQIGVRLQRVVVTEKRRSRERVTLAER